MHTYPYSLVSHFPDGKFTDMELTMIDIILDEEEEELHQVKKRKWIHEAWKKRESEGEFATLYK